MEESKVYSFEDVLKIIKTYIHNEDDINLIIKAYEFANEKHKDQFRKSGEAYIIHPLTVTGILASLHVGPNTIIAGLLHDVVEDTETTIEDLAKMFNDDVAQIVDGVTKVTKLQFTSLERQQVTNHQKMLLAMAKDIRVIVVKLCDRLHNMRTLDVMRPDKQVRIAKEVLHSTRHNEKVRNLVKGLMIESYIEDGCAKPEENIYGKSITDPCLGWEKTEKLIYELAELRRK